MSHHVDVAYSDPFVIPETNARGDWYGVQGVPDVRIDGKDFVIGAASCESAYAQYRQKILQRQSETGGLSPVEITGQYGVATGGVSVQARFRLVDPVIISDLQATFVVYEDSIRASRQDFYADTWSHVTRAIRSEPIELSVQGDEVVVTTSAAVPTSCNSNQLHVIAFIQRLTGNREVVQTAFLEEAFQVTIAPPFRSVPAGNGAAVFLAVLTNGRTEARSYVVTPGPVTGPEPSFGDWAMEFTNCGGFEFYPGPREVELGPEEACAMLVRVQTDSTREIRTGSLGVVSAGLALDAHLRVFNGGPAVLLVDGGAVVSMSAQMDQLGTLYDRWPENQPAPGHGDLSGYDILAWDGGVQGPAGSTAIADSAIAGFMEGGGAVFLASQAYLDQHPAGDFLRSWFGVESYLLDQDYVQVEGVPGDPIGDGLVLPLQFSHPYWNSDDLIQPVPAAHATLRASPEWAAAVRHTAPSGARSAFLAFPFSTISNWDPDPNNRTVVLGRVLDWLAGAEVSGTEPVIESVAESALAPPRPNPFARSVDLAFTISPRAAGAPARLELFDPAGRLVTCLWRGFLPAGSHRRNWDGRSDAGRPMSAGVYFARLTTAEGAQSRKLILLRN